MNKKAALLIVDVQNDFCPGGTLQIHAGDRIIEPINRAVQLFVAAGLPVLASRDWHPPVTSHFRDYGGTWPVHCVQGTEGASFHPALFLPEETVVLSKGISPERAGYSAFEGITDEGIPLVELLSQLEVGRLYICGLATDYCVLFTAREALQSGFEVAVLTDAIAGVDLVPGASASALEEMETCGARLTTVEGLLARSDTELKTIPVK